MSRRQAIVRSRPLDLARGDAVRPNETLPPAPQMTARAKAFRPMLFCPVRLGENQIRDMLRTHRELAGVDHCDLVYFDDCEQSSSKLLRKYAPDGAAFLQMENMPLSTYRDHLWTPQNVSRIAAIRNLGIMHFNSVNAGRPDDASYTHLFIVDADLFLHPETALSLAAAAAPIVSEVFWSTWPNMEACWLPNCWDYNEYAFNGPESVLRLAAPGVYPVGGLGACTLIRRDVLESEIVNYAPIYNRRHFGEDRDFCLRAAVAGHGLSIDTNRPAFHVYRTEQLDEARVWRDVHSSDPDYFRIRWLTPEWESKVRSIDQTPAVGGAAPKALKVACMLPGDQFSSLWVANWTNIFGELALGGHVMPFFGYSSNVFVTRACLWQALQDHSGTIAHPDFILWMDDDNLVTPEIVRTLIEDLKANPEASMAAGWCWIQPDGWRMDEAAVSAGRLDESMSCIPFTFAELESADSNLVEADYTGFPVVMMRGDMLARLGPLPFRPILSDGFTWGMSGEDVAFCVAARKAGCRIFVDRRVKVPHLKRQPAEPKGVGNPAAAKTEDSLAAPVAG